MKHLIFNQQSIMFSRLSSDTSPILLVAIALISYFIIHNLLQRRTHISKNIPQGSLGFPVIGESLSFLRAQRKNEGKDWINERVSRYGDVFKTSLVGGPTVVLTGQAGNKFVLGTDDGVLASGKPTTISRIAGKYSILELAGNRYKLLKGAMASFLKPENLQDYIGHMDDLVKTQLLRETRDKDMIKAVPFLKKIMFNVTCTLLFGLHDESTKEALFEDFGLTFKALWSIPVNFPGTVFWRGLRARSRIVKQIIPILRKRKQQLLDGTLSARSDILSCLLALRDENQEPLREEEITDNFVVLIMASHDTSTILATLMVWKLARDREIYEKILEEQMSILRERKGTSEGKLTWGEVQKMRYTWRVAQELMRLFPPIFGIFREATKDTNFGGYDIPKGWKVFAVASTTHMEKDIFANPTEFDPTRFENTWRSIPPFAYIPFGAGTRSCIGNEFARVETLVIIHHLVTNFEWSQVIPDELSTCEPSPYPSKGLPIKLKARNLSHYI